ncbi:hypothetical protein EJ05DRAFT_366559 [Pseudovirgaria hyperparasitica]|uniref:Uncharacterized protein n=1 Tax=Pseudovirgaria hyperparasitica TaxID=470096 RepID=A0A6A6VRK4_9PEZI|nr:uncharacterized protein EJ05DRAFT_366559 [Pseudovirgaria hyperparasitica]KAF2752416.1 hypothetical protein EJ05DRAFT_366559 [Pseudovirgaria hyperparasitica]
MDSKCREGFVSGSRKRALPQIHQQKTSLPVRAFTVSRYGFTASIQQRSDVDKRAPRRGHYSSQRRALQSKPIREKKSNASRPREPTPSRPLPGGCARPQRDRQQMPKPIPRARRCLYGDSLSLRLV